MPDVKPVTVSTEDPQSYEEAHVHVVYDEIAPHFSSTRYKPWPIIAAFLTSLPTGWVGIDLGTGNGKYLPLPSDRPGSVWTIGLDRSLNLLKIAKHAGDIDREVVRGDVLDCPWRPGAFDYAISIATIHHLATPARRTLAIQRVLQSISPSHGRALIYVWAIEQDELSKRNIPTESDTGNVNLLHQSAQSCVTKGQDVFVPWVLAKPMESKLRGERKANHTASPHGDTRKSDVTPPKVFDRFYHMFSRGELNELVAEAAVNMGLLVGHNLELDGQLTDHSRGKRLGVEIVQDGWERSNYYVELRRWHR